MDAHPPYPELVADPGWQRIDFVSDLHLSEAGPRTFAAFRDYLLGTPADAVFLLGDLFETWIGDDARHDGFEAEAAAVLRDAAFRQRLYFTAGNRDFLLGAEMLAACGITGLADPTLLTAFDERVMLTHGDAWCIDDVPYQQFRRQVRHPAWQAQVLARPLAERRLLARSMRSESERRGAEHIGEFADVDLATARGQMAAHAAPVMVHGHTHRPGSESLGDGRLRHVLSDWDLDHAPYRSEVMRRDRAGWRRLTVAEALAPVSVPVSTPAGRGDR